MSDMDKKARKTEGQSEKERVKQEVDRILEQDVAAKRQAKITEDPDLTKNWRFHNTKKLLQRYRSALMCISAALDDLDEQCLGDLGVRFTALGQFANQMDVDLSGTYLESRIRSMQRNKLMLQYIDKAIQSMRAYAKNGEEFYWLLYFKYLSSNEDICQSDSEIIERMRDRGLPISSSTFYRRFNMAIETLSGILWGFTARDTWTLTEFFNEK